jgi:hypothetical protein
MFGLCPFSSIPNGTRHLNNWICFYIGEAPTHLCSSHSLYPCETCNLNSPELSNCIVTCTRYLSVRFDVLMILLMPCSPYCQLMMSVLNRTKWDLLCTRFWHGEEKCLGTGCDIPNFHGQFPSFFSWLIVGVH